MKSGKIHHSSFTLQTFFSKFDLFAEVPDAVTKMRELVLELAVRGSLFSSGHPCMTAPSAPFPIPKDWQWVALNNAANCRAVTKVESSSLKDSDWVLDLEDIDGGAGKVIATVTYAQRRSLSTKAAFQAGDVLYGKLRPYLNKVVVAARSGFCTTEIIPLRPHAFLAPGYLCLFLRSPHFLRYAAAKNYGMKMPRLGTTDLELVKLPLPPLAEQRRIVAKVDELMALCDRLEAQQKERETRHAALARASLARFANAPTPAKLDILFHSSFSIPPSDLRKSILTLAVQGKLVPQDANDEPAEVTFPKLASVAVIGDGDDFPARWLRVPLGWLGEWRGGGTPSKSSPDFWQGFIPWVSPKDMKTLHIMDSQDHISPAAVEGSSVRLIPTGSLLMVVRGMILARAFPVALTMRDVTINQDMKALLPYELKTKDYLLLALRAFEREILAAIEHSSHGTCKLKTEFLHDFVLPIPPLAEQRRIVAKVDELMALVDELEARLADSRAAGEKLLTALVAELTAGKKSPA
jgi:type I restriction enzyme S subunit